MFVLVKTRTVLLEHSKNNDLSSDLIVFVLLLNNDYLSVSRTRYTNLVTNYQK